MPIHIHIEAETAKEAREHLRGLLSADLPEQHAAPAAPKQVDVGADVSTGYREQEQEQEAPPSAGTPATSAGRVDEHGVEFNPEFCGEATEPFYGSGKRKGQWKKRRGVDDVQYDAWYDSVRPEPAQEQAPQPDQPPTDVGAAFRPQAQPPAPAAGGYPSDIGGFTAWTSERMAASQITQTHVDRAFKDCGLGYHDIMPGAPDAAGSIAKVCQQIESYGRGH